MDAFDNYKHSELTGQIIHLAYYVYNALGFGFVEKVYENSLAKKLRGWLFRRLPSACSCLF